MKSIIHVNRANVVANRRDGGKRPVFTVKDYRQNRKGSRVICYGPVEFVDGPALKCGARVYAVTHGVVEVEP